jgi:hypothetical protein
MKKLLTLLFAFLVAFSLTAPTFADQTTKAKSGTVKTTTKKTPTTGDTPPQGSLKTGKTSTKKTLETASQGKKTGITSTKKTFKTVNTQAPPSRQGPR